MNRLNTPGLCHKTKLLLIISIMLFFTSACNSGGGDEPSTPQGSNWDQMQWDQDQWS